MHKGGLSCRFWSVGGLHLYGTLVESLLKWRTCDELKPETLKGILGLGRTWVQNGRNHKNILRSIL